MKEKELREHAKCSLCNNFVVKSGLPLFWKVSIERFGMDLKAIERQQGLTMMLGGYAALAAAMGPDENMAQPVMDKVVLTVCETCAYENSGPVALLAEVGKTRNSRNSET